MIGAHDLLEHESVLWIDMKNVKTAADLLSALSSQLSLGVLHLEQVDKAMTGLIESIATTNPSLGSSQEMVVGHSSSSSLTSLSPSQSHSNAATSVSLSQSLSVVGNQGIVQERTCSVILDHVDIGKVEGTLEMLRSLIVTLSKLQQQYFISVVLILSQASHDFEVVSQLSKGIGEIVTSTSNSSSDPPKIDFLYIDALQYDEAMKLASFFAASDPALLVKTGKCLPGLMKCLHTIPQHVLSSIANSEDPLGSFNNSASKFSMCSRSSLVRLDIGQTWTILLKR